MKMNDKIIVNDKHTLIGFVSVCYDKINTVNRKCKIPTLNIYRGREKGRDRERERNTHRHTNTLFVLENKIFNQS